MNYPKSKLSAAAIAVLCVLEGFVSLPYKDIAGIWTDGYGNTVNVVPGRAVSEPKARADLEAHVRTFSSGVLELTGPLTQGQLDSYTLLTYNIGLAAFKSSQTLKSHRLGNYADACLYSMRYDKATINKKLTVVRGLALRRYTEYNLCIYDLPPGSWTREGKR